MSAPAANALWLPVRTIAAIEESVERVVSAAFRSLKRGVERAFRARGRLRVTKGTLRVNEFVRNVKGKRGGVQGGLRRATLGLGWETRTCSYVG